MSIWADISRTENERLACQETDRMDVKSQEIPKELKQRCTGRNGLCSAKPGQVHAPCSGQTAKGAATYSRELCKAILRGMRRQLKALNMIQTDCYGLQHSGFEELEMVGVVDKQKCSGQFRDDISGQLLQDDLVLEARQRELEYFKQKSVWEKITRSKARSMGCKPVTTRWVDVNKGSEVEPNYR